MNGLPEMRTYVAYYGVFDFQRNEGHGMQRDNMFYTMYTDASNYGVGVYMAGSGSSWQITDVIGSYVAAQGKASDADVRRARRLWKLRWEAGQSMRYPNYKSSPTHVSK